MWAVAINIVSDLFEAHVQKQIIWVWGKNMASQYLINVDFHHLK